jgi:MarR family transcriptional regulator, negative regulator of the multidrug operon emrRAB
MHDAYISSIQHLQLVCGRHIFVTLDRTTNLLGALALALTDRIGVGMRELLGRSGETAPAIVVLGYAPGLSVEVLRQVLGLSHPGTVRLIDRLADDGLVERRKAVDGRAVALHLTPKGAALRTDLMDRRVDRLEAALDGLTADERLMFGELIARVLKNLPETEMAKHNICRLCAVRLCTDCPIPGNAV